MTGIAESRRGQLLMFGVGSWDVTQPSRYGRCWTFILARIRLLSLSYIRPSWYGFLQCFLSLHLSILVSQFWLANQFKKQVSEHSGTIASQIKILTLDYAGATSTDSDSEILPGQRAWTCVTLAGQNG